MLMIAARRLAYLLLIALISGWLPQAAVVAPLPAAPVALAAPAGGALGDPPAPPAPLKVAPVTDPHLPSLSLHITVAPDPVALGDTVALTITLMNDAPDPANNVVITLPTPDGALAVPGPNTISPTGGWQWALKSLDGRSSTSVTGSLRMVQRPAGDALLLRATVIAQGLAQPLPGVGGALVVDRTLGPVTSPFTPGSPVTVRSRDGRIQVQVPARAAAQALTLRYGTTPLDGARIPPATANFHRGMGAFFLDATDAQGTAVHQFTAPLTITMSYTPEQLDALGIAEPDLTLFWFDDTTPITHTDGLVTYGQWLPIPTTVDARTHRATVGVDHFTTFELSDGSSPSIAFLPGIQGWQVSLFTGAAAYSYPIDLPAGPGGFKPSLSLSYSSAATDGDAGKRQLAQAGWVGQGWSLDTGSIAANKMVNGQNYYALTVNGQSFDLLRGAALVSPSDDTNPTNWEWKPTDENFMRVRAVSNGTSDPATGGGYDRNHVLIPRTRWQVWMKDGTRYDFADEAWWGFCGDADSVIEPSRWLLSQVVDTHGNSITYTYDHSGMAITKLTDTSGCAHVQGTVYKDIWPSTISWAGGRYQVNFISSARTDDLNYATASNQFLGPDDTQHQTRQLNAIQVWSNPAGSWQLVRQYNLGYDYSLTPDTMTCPSSCSATNTDYRKLTLTSIQRVGSNGALFPSTLTPIKTTFGYGGFGSTTDTNGSWVAGSWNRLTSVNNGQGGTVSFAYANVGQAAGNHLMDNNRRVISKTIGDGQDHSYTWNYSYGTPNVNSLGTTRGPLALQWNYDNYGTQTYPNSAALYYNAFIDTSANQQVWLAHKAMREFRGHDYVAETDPTGAQTEHWFHQGEAVTSASLPDITCVPTITGPTLPTGLCFQELRNGEQLKGREYRTRVRASAGGTQLQEIDHAFSVTWFPSNLSIPLAGLWHAFTAETQADLYSGTSSLSVKKTTRYTYDPSYTSIYSPTTGLYEASNVQYGNLSMIEEDTQDGVTPLRVTERRYSGRTDGVNYLVDRQYSESVRDGLPPNGLLRAMSQTFFDGNNTSPMTLGTIGDVTRVAKYYDVPLANNAQNVTLHGQDTTFTYDSWGNQLTETTYAQPGTRWYDGTNWDISAPGASSATRTSTTAYDGMFHAFPTSFSNPLGQTTRADYDYRMGTLIRVTGPNTSGTPTDCTPTSFSIPATEESSCAQYDVFGRMIALVKPGDSTSYPTVQATYYDTEQPFHYLVQQREISGQAGIRPIQHFYDGLGREIQVKRESAEGAQNIVVDTIYDGLDRVYQQSQARSVNETPATTFWLYTPPGGPLYNPTTTSYDALGRPVDVALPDSTHTTTQLSVGAIGVIASTTDAKGHKTARETDLFGRLRQLVEYSGNGGSEGGYATYATTNYAYDPLDRLTTVTDAQSSVTSISYDSLGRKTHMTDPNMGIWNYLYDANSNLTRQTDARGQRICLYYDALDRLAGKHYRTDDACPATFPAGAADASYSYDQGTNGKGQRTAMSLAGASTSWLYDARGRSTNATHTVPGLSGTRVFDWTYDSADRVQTLTYPAVGANPREVLTYTYDSAWRPTSACTSFSGCYATASQPYTALDQPTQWTFGNNLIQTWSYNSPMARLQQLQVGTVATPGSLFSRSYTYDNVGNVATISDPQLPETQNFAYDHRDRLTRACTTSATCSSPLAGMLQPGGAMATTPSLRTTRVPGLAALSPIAQATTADMGALITPPDNIASAPDQPDAAPASIQQPAAPQAPAPSANAFARLPLAFVPNQGQSAAAVRFMARSGGGTLFFTPDEAVLNLPSQSEALTATALLTSTVVRLRYLGAAPNPEMRAGDRLPGVVHYLRGSDPTQWKTNLPTYNGIVYAGLYDGVDLRYEGSDGRLKSTYHVAAGSDPTRIRWRYIGATDVQVDASNGNLLIQVPVPGRGSRSGQLREEAPSAWQDIDGQRVPVSVRFEVGLDSSVHFVLGTYNPAHPLVIDPVLSYSTYLGGTSTDKGQSITVDGQGQAYIAGSALSTNFPTTSGAYQGGRAGDDDVFISKLSPDGTQLLYSTYLGGSDADEGYGIALDSAGNIAITGHTQSSDFPTTSSGVDTSFGGTTDAFVTSLTANGSALRYSTYLGGSSDDQGWDIAVPSDGRLYVVGTTLGGLPSALASYDTTYNTGSGDAFVSVIDPTLSGSASLRYSTYLGGTLTDRGAAIAVDSNGYAVVTGRTASTNFPVVNAYQSTKASNQDVFVAQLDPTVNGSSSLRYSTYLGGSSDEEGSGIAVTSSGVAVVVGFTTSNNFPTLTPYQATRQGDKEGFLTRINPALSGAASLVASTYLGGSDAERDLDVVVDSSGLFVLSGYTRSANFPLVAALQSSLGGGTCGTGTPYPCGDALVMRFDPIANAPSFSTYLGGNDDDEGRGVAVDASGAIYITGFTFSPNFPTANPHQSALNGTATDAFIAKIDPGSGAPTPYDETYAYDSVGNLTLKGPTGNGKSYTYGAQSAGCATGALTKRHAVINDGVTAYCYDANGNMLSGGNRSYGWDAENRPSSISSGGVSESYCYDADGERVKRAVGSMTTVYLGGLWEEVIGGAVKSYYTLNGTVVAVRDSGTNAVTYLHGDHLGSISVASNASAQATSQTFDPWGKRRSGGISQTSLNYTSQRLDSGTGLLYYHARYYDPVLGRFLSADTAVSGQNDMMGPANPQELNRYSYVNNNPLRYTDSTGHAVDPPPCVICDLDPIDISQWSEPAQGAAVVACLVLGCHVNNAVITAPTYEEWLQDQVLGMMPGPAVLRTVTSRAVGNRAQRFVLRIAQEAERRVLKKGAEGSLATAQAAAARGADILPGLFKYESQPSIAGYAQHHLWPQAMGGPKEGWTVYARNVHSAAGGIQDRMNVYLRTQLGMQQRQVEAWARQHPEAILDHLRQFYKAEGIGFPY